MKYRIIKNGNDQFIPQYRYWFLFWSSFHRSTGFMSYEEIKFTNLDDAIRFIKIKKKDQDIKVSEYKKTNIIIAKYNENGEQT